MMPFWRQACGLSLRCRWYIFDWHSSLLFTFYKAQKYKDFLKRQKILDIFLRNVEIMFSGDIFLCKVTKSFVN